MAFTRLLFVLASDTFKTLCHTIYLQYSVTQHIIWDSRAVCTYKDGFVLGERPWCVWELYEVWVDEAWMGDLTRRQAVHILGRHLHNTCHLMSLYTLASQALYMYTVKKICALTLVKRKNCFRTVWSTWFYLW